MHFRPQAKIEEITSLRTGDVICHRHITTGLRIPPTYFHQNKKAHLSVCFLFWRSRRDSNSRAAFGDYTISSRARYDHFDTTPYSLALNNSIVYYSKDLAIVKKKMTNLERKFQGGAERAARTLLRLAATPDFPCYIMSATDSTAESTALPTFCMVLPTAVFLASGRESIAAPTIAPTIRPAPIPHKYEPVRHIIMITPFSVCG